MQVPSYLSPHEADLVNAVWNAYKFDICQLVNETKDSTELFDYIDTIATYQTQGSAQTIMRWVLDNVDWNALVFMALQELTVHPMRNIFAD